MNPLECKACFEEYHATTRRPRALPCGHSYCEPCMGILKTNQMIKCPTCRREHNVTDVTELMIVYDLIELLDSKQIQKTVFLNKGECEEHGCPLNFFCATHLEWICRDCTVLEHPKEECSIRTKKQFLQEKVTKEKVKLIAEKENHEKCQSHLRENCDEIKREIVNNEELITKLQSLLGSHVHSNSSLKKEVQSIENAIKEIGANNSKLISMIPSISAITDFNGLEVALKESEGLLCKAQEWRENEMKKYPEKFGIKSQSDEIKLKLAELINLSLKKKDPATLIVHKNTFCDECRSVDIQGDRYGCLVCKDYDICGNCESTGLHGHHVKIKFPKCTIDIRIDPSSGVLDSSGRKDSICGPVNALDSSVGKWDAKKGMTSGCWNPCDLPQYYNKWYIVFDLKVSHTVMKIYIRNFGDTKHDIQEFKLESSIDNTTWISASDKFVAKVGTKRGEYFGNFYATGRYWKLTVLKTPEGFQPWLTYLMLRGFQN